MIGMAAPCMDSDLIRRLDMQAFDALKMYFEVSASYQMAESFSRVFTDEQFAG